MTDPAQELLDLIAGDSWRMDCLKAVADLGLPDGWIGAGFLRAPLWDKLDGYATPTPLADIDVIYFDAGDLDPATELGLEDRLRSVMPSEPWSLRNQARMHLRNGDAPYRSTADALRHWLETPTAVAVRLGKDGKLELLAPLGLDDLFAMTVRPTPHARAHRLEAYRKRLASKGWKKRWPKLRVLEL